MVTAVIAAKLARTVPSSPSRVGAVINRNVGALRSGPSYWLVLFSGFFEPVLYLFSIGVGVGTLIGDLDVDGRVLSYAAFVAPAMLAVSAMSGALAETTFNFFFKFKYVKTYDAMLATPIRPMEIAIGELAWAMHPRLPLHGRLPDRHGRDGADHRLVGARGVPGDDAGGPRLRRGRHGGKHRHPRLAGFRSALRRAVRPVPVLRDILAGAGLSARRGDPHLA